MSDRQARRYLIALALFLLLSTGVSLFQRLSIVGCPGYGYGPGLYLSECTQPSYGDYQHGGLALAIEPVRKFVRRAKVVFLGDSHPMFAFSGPATKNYLTERNLPYYNFSVSGESREFVQRYMVPMLNHPQLVVIDTDPFFWPDNMKSPAAKFIEENPVQAFIDYRVKRAWQVVHRPACANIDGWGGSICGRKLNGFLSVFRRIDNGETDVDYTTFFGNVLPKYPVHYGDPTSPAEVATFLPYAQEFIASLGVPRQCIILTSVPYSHTHEQLAEGLARAAGVRYVDPLLPGLTTVDTGHFDGPSREAWTAAFWQAAAPILDACTGTAAP